MWPKQYLRKKKYEVLMLYLSWEDRGPDQMYIDLENWKRFYYMRKSDEERRRIRRRYNNTHTIFLHNSQFDKKYEILEQLEKVDLKKLWVAYRNRTELNYSSLPGIKNHGGVVIGGKSYFPSHILWVIKYRVNNNSYPTNKSDEKFLNNLIKKIG